ncbi:WAT1-related At2g39510-like [Olea europaea subsp. europaea]|uniref:WAT1-related protein n=1 Tax=Olea europaea subsp. europaea TaxID=158383 RepID=A0A8S0V8F7_OLEEU|nr:WAT1-related At2g39510-like [Olea europaea subsp. europaea]
MELSNSLKQMKPYLAVIFLRLSHAVLSIIAKYALNQGMSYYTFSVYRNAIAAVAFVPFAILLERNTRPRMTLAILYKIVLPGLSGPVIEQNLFYFGMKYITATFAISIYNMLPAITFVLAWMLRYLIY